MSTTPVPLPGQVNQGLLQRLAVLAKSLAPAVGLGAGPTNPGANPNTPGSVGSVPSVAAPAPGVVLPGVSPATGVGIQSSAAPTGPMPRREFVPTPAPVSSGLAFPDTKTAWAGTVHDAISNLTSVVNAHKARTFQQEEKRAEVLTRSLYDAIGRGDNDTVNSILSDQKNLKILEKAGVGVPPEIKVEKIEPPNPAESGLHKGIRYSIAAKQSPVQAAAATQAQAATVQAQNQVIQQQAAQQKLQADPNLAATMGLGTTLSGDELRKKELWDSGFQLSPVAKTAMDASQSELSQKIGVEYAKLSGQMEMAKDSNFYELEAKKMEVAGRTHEAELLRGVESKHYDNMYKIQKNTLEFRRTVSAAKTKEALFKGFKDLSDSYEHEITNLRTQASTLQKIDTSESLEQAKKFNDMADRLAIMVQNSRGIVEAEQTKQEMQSIMQGE